MKKKFKFIHLIPTPYGGGVESAGNSFLKYTCENYDFKVCFLKNNKNQKFFITYLKAFKYIFAINPDIILTSLWKSNLITLVFKILNIKTKYILFLHSTKNKHLIDGLISTLASLFAYEIWADSEETLIKRIDSFYIFKFYKTFLINKNKKRIISFILKKLNPLDFQNCKPSFIYWGRLCPNKNIEKAIKLFSEILKKDSKSEFIIIGSDYGAKKSIYKTINNFGLRRNVIVYDFMNFKQIQEYAKKVSFFIQLSSYEGMAMSVAESMQLGLIPVVTNVGQIKVYCKDNYNCLLHNNNDKEIVSKIYELINSKEKYNHIRRNTINTWNSSRIYKEDIIASFERIIKKI